MVASIAEWPGPLVAADAGALAALRGLLLESGFDGPGVRDALGAEGQLLARPADVPVLRRRLASLDRLGTIVTLFVLDTPVAAARARRALSPLSLERLEALGLVESGGGLVRARVRLVPHDDVLIASDRVHAGSDEPDHVAGIHNPSVTLAQLTVRRPVESALDVGTGCGVQAILAARHSARVVATDVNRRALNFAAFNTRLNGAANVELRAGSFFEPVGGERFELVVCNPPYVVSPDTDYLFRDGGLAGDSVSRRVVEAVPAVLAEGGFATTLVSWVQPPGEDWSAAPRRWVEGGGCDALLLHYETQDPLTHTAAWTADRRTSAPEETEAVLDRWLGYFDRLGIEGIAYGGVVLRRRDDAGPHHVLAHDLPRAGLRPAGTHIERLFGAADHLAARGDAPLLGERLALVERARVEQLARLRDGEWSIERIELRLDEGLRFEATVDAVTAHLLAALDGTRTLGEACVALADAQGLDPAELAGDADSVVRRMLALGFLQRR